MKKRTACMQEGRELLRLPGNEVQRGLYVSTGTGKQYRDGDKIRSVYYVTRNTNMYAVCAALGRLRRAMLAWTCFETVLPRAVKRIL